MRKKRREKLSFSVLKISLLCRLSAPPHWPISAPTPTPKKVDPIASPATCVVSGSSCPAVTMALCNLHPSSSALRPPSTLPPHTHRIAMETYIRQRQLIMSPLIPSRVIGENEPLTAVFNKVIATREVNHKGQGETAVLFAVGGPAGRRQAATFTHPADTAKKFLTSALLGFT